MKVRCKMQLQEIVNYGGTGKTFVFRPQYDTSIPEDQRFNTATPSGEFKVMVNNPAVIAHYEIGKFYYFDSEPVSLPASSPVAAPVAT